jgi:hypothetical protein
MGRPGIERLRQIGLTTSAFACDVAIRESFNTVRLRDVFAISHPDFERLLCTAKRSFAAFSRSSVANRNFQWKRSNWQKLKSRKSLEGHILLLTFI